MPDLSFLYAWTALLPLECMRASFMQRAMLALILLAPMTASLGVHVVNFRMSFFSDAISHSAFAGVAAGLLLGLSPGLTTPLLGLAIGLGIMAVVRNNSLPSDTVIGVFFSTVVAFGLAVVSRENTVARDVQQFLYGDVLTLGDSDILWLILLFLALALFQFRAYNRMLYIALNPSVAKAHGIGVAACQYAFAALLALVVMVSVRGVGVLLVTALLIVPAASARNLARSAGGAFGWAVLISLCSAVAGLLLSAQDWLATATGATVILVAAFCFALSALVKKLRQG